MGKDLDELNHYKMDELINKIEENQNEQNQIIELKSQEINYLIEENKRLKELLKENNEIILMLNNEIKNLSDLLLKNENKIKEDVEDKIKILYAILDMSKKVDRQKKEMEIYNILNSKK